MAATNCAAMTVTQRLMKPGRWRLALIPDTPFAVTSAIGFLDHIVITPTRLYPVEAYTDANVLASAIYSGPLTSRPTPTTLEGYDNSYWLGTPDGLGDILETPLALVASSLLSTWWGFLKPAALNTGTITNTGTVPGAQGPFQWVTRREAFDAVCRGYGAEWRVNPNFTVDAAIPSTLWTTAAPTVVVTRKKAGAEGPFNGLDATQLVTKSDVEQLTTKVYAVTQGPGTLLAAGAIVSSFGTGYKDPLNNNVIFERVVNAPTEPAANATTVAAAIVGQYQQPLFETTLSSKTYNVSRFVRPGDTVYVYDREAGLTDATKQITFQGQLISPKTLRVERGMGVYIRRSGATPTYTDVTDFVAWEDGDVTWEIGKTDSSLSNNTSLAGGTATLGANKDVGLRMSGFGPLQPYTPVLKQGTSTPSIANNDSKYTRSGRWVQGLFDVSLNPLAVGLAGGTITVTLPLPVGGIVDAHVHLGRFRLEISASSAKYSVGELVPITSTTAGLCVTAQGSTLSDTFLGSNTFTAALAEFDRVTGSFAYETTAD